MSAAVTVAVLAIMLAWIGAGLHGWIQRRARIRRLRNTDRRDYDREGKPYPKR